MHCPFLHQLRLIQTKSIIESCSVTTWSGVITIGLGWLSGAVVPSCFWDFRPEFRGGPSSSCVSSCFWGGVCPFTSRSVFSRCPLSLTFLLALSYADAALPWMKNPPNSYLIPTIITVTVIFICSLSIATNDFVTLTFFTITFFLHYH